MEKCARSNCNCLIGENKVEVDGKVYCNQECADHCMMKFASAKIVAVQLHN
ncbi:metallothionein [Bacillus pacificus]|uniref:metallothionein n=1 Tax=Bacillus pacificus TaxID=2026187 RepID=UPI002D78E4F6|nr:metallothionein [Bacillus pacificus]